MRSNLSLVFTLLFSGILLAQKPLPSDTFKVIKEYEPILINADKISSEPQIDDTLKIDLDLSYSFVNKQVPVSFEVEPILPAKIKGEPLVRLYNGYARLGVGNALVPFAEVYYNNLRSKKYSIGGHARYFNMVEVNNIEDNDMSEMHFEVFGKRFWKTNTLDANISFGRHDFNYYGYNQIAQKAGAIEIPKPDLTQYYNRLTSTFTLKSTKRDSFNIRHEANLKYNLLSNANSNAENNIVGTLNLNQFRNNELYNVDISIDYNQYEFNADNTIISLRPQISTIGDKFRINAGLGIYVNAASKADFHFYPLAEIKYNVIEDILVPYVGIKGEIRRVNYSSITLENPFVAEDITLSNANEKYNLYAGLRGTLSSRFSFNISGASIKTDGAYLYVQLPDTNRILTKEYYLTYDEIDELRFKGELVYRLNEKIQVYALGEYMNYTTKNEEEAWHRPELKISTSARYNLHKKIYVKLDIIYWGEQYARGEVLNIITFTGIEARNEVNKLDGIFDANLSFEYRYTKRLSAFIKFNNIGGINFEKYQDYPTQGFNVWGGLTYGF